MAKKQSFSDKASKKKHIKTCPVCDTELTRVKWIKAERAGASVRYRTQNIGVCKCNESEVYS